jgi:excisionase family DNA binding protein
MHVQGTAVPSEPGTARFGSPSGDRIAYTVAEVATLLGKHSNTVYGWVRSGALPSERIGNTIYIPKWALARLQAKREPTPGLGKGKPQGGRARGGRRAGVARLPRRGARVGPRGVPLQEGLCAGRRVRSVRAVRGHRRTSEAIHMLTVPTHARP